MLVSLSDESWAMDPIKTVMQFQNFVSIGEYIPNYNDIYYFVIQIQKIGNHFQMTRDHFKQDLGFKYWGLFWNGSDSNNWELWLNISWTNGSVRWPPRSPDLYVCNFYALDPIQIDFNVSDIYCSFRADSAHIKRSCCT